MSRFSTAFCAAVAVVAALPASAGAAMDVIPANDPEAAAGCPGDCVVMDRTLGYQAKVGTERGLMTVPKDGTIVSWSIKLGTPATKPMEKMKVSQLDWFKDRLGGAPKASIAVFRPGKRLRARVVAVSKPMRLDNHFGKTAEFALDQTIPVKKGWIIGLSVPKWAPIMATKLDAATSWRASRKKDQCDGDSHGMTAYPVGAVPQFYCLYKTERLLYSARLISTE